MPWDLRVRGLVAGVPASPQQQFESGVECQPSSASLPPTARLQSKAFSCGFAPELLSAIMAQLLKCLVVQHDASSSPILCDVRVGLNRQLQPMCYSRISFPIGITGTAK